MMRHAKKQNIEKNGAAAKLAFCNSPFFVNALKLPAGSIAFIFNLNFT